MHSSMATSLGLLLPLLFNFTPQYSAAYAVSTAAAAATTCVGPHQQPTCCTNYHADNGGIVKSSARDCRWVPRGRSGAATPKLAFRSQRPRRRRSWQLQAEGGLLISGIERDDDDDLVVFVGSCRGGGSDVISARQVSTIGDENNRPARTRATDKGVARAAKVRRKI